MQIIDPDKRQLRAILTLIVSALILIVGIWIGAWYVGVAHPGYLSGATSQPLADLFSSINALFAGLAFGGVIITVYMQIQELRDTRDELRRTAEANQKMAEASMAMARSSDEKAVLDLFQTYCSDYFQGVKNSAMSVLIPCVASKAYCDFVVSRLFVAGQLPLPADCWPQIEARHASYCKSFEEFKQQEQNHRYKLDELINFFTLLTGRQHIETIVRRCDFSYAWWRPLLWMLATLQRQRHAQVAIVQTYATPLYLLDVVRVLDGIYGFTPFETERAMWTFFVEHPKIQAYGLDPGYKELLA